MKNLKEKLFEKAEIIKEKQLLESEYVNESTIQSNNIDEYKALAIVPDFAITINDAKSRISMLQTFIKDMMISNIDYGIIPGCQKPSLYKAGAEKLCDIFGFSKQIEVINRIEDWDKGIFHYEVKTTLINKRSGQIESEGIGSCNCKEKKFKNQDPYNIVNTILKMAKKRSFIDAVLSATRSSGIFTQDIEDLEADTSRQATDTSQPSSTNSLANKGQLSEILYLITQKKIAIDTGRKIMLERYKVNESKQLTTTQAQDFINYLLCYRSA